MTNECPDCGGMMSPRAKFCPHCGRSGRAGAFMGDGCLSQGANVGCLIIVVILVLIYWMSNQ